MSENKKGRFTASLMAGLLKSTKILKIIKLFKVAKPLILLISMSISAIAYAFYFGPWLAIVFVVLLLIHEMGHVVAMRMKGLDTPTPVFIPFLGAAIFAPKFTERHTEAFVGYGGPLLGSIGALAVFGLWFLLPKHTPLSAILLVGSYLGTYLNLFNLLPISPLDGGRVTQAAGRWFKYVGLLALAILSVVWKQLVILYIWIIVLFDLTLIPVRLRAGLISILWLSMATLMYLGYGHQPWWVNLIDCALTLIFVIWSIYRAFNKVEDAENDTRPDLSSAQRIQWFGMYLGLAAVLSATVALQMHFLPHIK